MEQTQRNGNPPLAIVLPAAPDKLAVQLIPITKFHSEDATRFSLSWGHVSKLEADMRRRQREFPKEHPVTTPLRVICRGEMYPVVAGNHRLAAALRIPLLDLPAIVLSGDLTPIQFFIEANRDNLLREGYSPVESARNILHVKNELGVTQAEAGRMLGIECASETSKFMRVLKRFPEDLLDKIGEGDGKVPFTSAYKLTQLSDESQIRDLADKAIRGLLCRDRLVDAVDKLLGSGKRQKEKPIKFSACGISGVIKGNPLEALKALHGKIAEVLKRIERDPALADVLPSLLKGA